jgi:uncharacterized protein YaiL (DUF2058 family)
MAGLRDQLLKSGLVNEKQVKKAQKEKHKEQRSQGKSHAGEDEEAQRRLRVQAEKLERDRRLNQQRKDDANKKALAAQARQLIEVHQQPRNEGETPFSFTDGGKIKKLMLETRVRDQLVRGQLAIVKVDQAYELVPRETAEKILQRDAAFLILMNEPSGHNEPSSDDPYADYQVPDDLIW